MFRRDEIDVLEDELDEVFDLHERSRDAVHRSMEASVIGEQTRTEDAYERALADLLGPASLAPEESHACEHCGGTGVPDGVPLRDLLDEERDPLYARAYRWARGAFEWSRACYRTMGLRNRDMFRVYVNAYLVPVKIAFALAEEGRESDEFSPRIAGLEYDLAVTYLVRSRDSLSALRSAGLADADMGAMILEADAIRVLISERRERLPLL